MNEQPFYEIIISITLILFGTLLTQTIISFKIYRHKKKDIQQMLINTESQIKCLNKSVMYIASNYDKDLRKFHEIDDSELKKIISMLLNNDYKLSNGGGIASKWSG